MASRSTTDPSLARVRALAQDASAGRFGGKKSDGELGKCIGAWSPSSIPQSERACHPERPRREGSPAYRSPPEPLRVLARGHQLAQCRLDARTVVRVGHAEPAAVRALQAHARLASAHRVPDAMRDQELALPSARLAYEL